MQSLQDIASAYGINLLTREEAEKIDPSYRFASKRISAVFRHNTTKHIFIHIGDNNTEEEKIISLYHELGHIKHSMGWTSNEYCLTDELAANTWALKHCPIEMGKTIAYLRRAILSYLADGVNTSIRHPELEETAMTLNIYDLIKWIEP